MERNEGHTFTLIKIVNIEKVFIIKSKIKSIEWQSYVSYAKFKKEIVYESVDEFRMK